MRINFDEAAALAKRISGIALTPVNKDPEWSGGSEMVRSEIEQRLRRLEEQIAEVKKRLPAHSVKPPIMLELLTLEDERDALLKTLGAVEPDNGQGGPG